MTKFSNPYENPAYVKQAIVLYLKYSKFLDDDYADAKNDKVQYFFDLINRTYPYFWVITEGEKVTKGQSIGTVGNTAVFEVADEAHLHFEILKDSIQVDPSIYLK